MRIVKVFSLSVVTFLLACCSLNYGDETKTTDKVPEFIFKNVEFSRYEANKKSSSLKAELLEQFKGGSVSYARNATFETWNEKKELVTSGSCQLMGIDTGVELYTMFNNIHLKNYSQKIEIMAQSLKWNGKSQQLTSGKNDTVHIKKEDMTLSGKGFSASAVNSSFVFSQGVDGLITVKEEQNQNKPEETEEHNEE